MTIDPQVLRAERHVEIGRVLQRRAHAIVDHWASRAAEEQPDASRVHEQVLLDHLPKLLQTLGQSLADPAGPLPRPLSDSAAEHGQQRWQAGWSLAEVVRDYQILRLVIVEQLETELQRSLLTREILAIGLALDEAIAASIAAYVQHRDGVSKRLEQNLRDQADQLREADRRKNEFLAVLAHELRNPMAPILNAVQVLNLLGPADANIKQACAIVERQVQQMVRLVDDLLDLTRIAQGKIELRQTTFDLAAAVARAIQTVTPLFETQQHHLSAALPTEPLRMEGDQDRIVQVLVNLLTNAGKYTDKGGRIHLTAGREDGEVVLRVRDNGVGIESDMLARVFDMFTQIDHSLPRSRGGLGIGLTLVRQLVELHNGRVSAHSDGPGQGSEFVVRLPAAEASTEPVASPTSRPELPPLHILIIEDHADARSTLQQLLTLLGHRVETAADGLQGVEAGLTGRPNVALVDLSLPSLDGLEVARRLRAGLGESVRLVALTGHASEEDRRVCLDAGFDAHLAKPVDLEALNRLLADASKPRTTPS
ncbi:MAG TPA: hybrid sensor histidine kinase/response regulator [Planctomycetales bacterium]|jgi:signal transduction histidine kinase/CheY-like chemotaxis protein|nr:hybrid sensor histidine kinase/response regulator [Planctomycetales bacterium]